MLFRSLRAPIADSSQGDGTTVGSEGRHNPQGQQRSSCGVAKIARLAPSSPPVCTAPYLGRTLSGALAVLCNRRCCLPTKTRDPVAQDSSRPECEAPHEQVSRRPVNEAQRELCQQLTAVRRAQMTAVRYNELCRPSAPSKLLSCGIRKPHRSCVVWRWR